MTISSAAASISIHAPREGSDVVAVMVLQLGVISIHAPREGSDHQAAVQEQAKPQFQSTLPVRGATSAFWRFLEIFSFQSTLPVRGATLPGYREKRQALISIHAPREGSDVGFATIKVFNSYFNPRSP